MAWCELRQDFRHFRADRVLEAEFLEDRYPERGAILRARWKRSLEQAPRKLFNKTANSDPPEG